MVAMVPFDWQAHDTYFVVAHLHYVLIGGMVFPLFAAIYYWAPALSRRALSETLGRWSFWLMFLGFNIGVLPHASAGPVGDAAPRPYLPCRDGLADAQHDRDRRRLHACSGSGCVPDRSCAQSAASLSEHAGNVWKAGTLEWMPNHVYGPRSIPLIDSRYPLWQQPDLEQEVEAARHYLPNAPTGVRETIITSPIEAEPQYLQRLPGPGWSPFLAAVFTAAFFMLLTVKWVTVARRVRRPRHRLYLDLDLGQRSRAPWQCRYRLRHQGAGLCDRPDSHAWWAVVILMLVAGSLYFAFVFSYLYLWTVAPQAWSERDGTPCIGLADRRRPHCSPSRLQAPMLPAACSPSSRLLCAVALLVALGSLGASLWVEFAAHWRGGSETGNKRVRGSGLPGIGSATADRRSTRHHGSHTCSRASPPERADDARRVTFDCLALLIYFAAGQGLLGLLLVHGFPQGGRMNGTQQPLSNLLWALAGPFVWFAHFVSLYLAEAFLCVAPGPYTATNLRVIGVILTLLALTALLVASFASAYVIAAGRTCRWPLPHNSPFAGPLTLLSILAVLWTSVPMFLLPACGPAAGDTQEPPMPTHPALRGYGVCPSGLYRRRCRCPCGGHLGTIRYSPSAVRRRVIRGHPPHHRRSVADLCRRRPPLRIAISGASIVLLLAAAGLLFGPELAAEMRNVFTTLPEAANRLAGHIQFGSLADMIRNGAAASALGGLASRIVAWSTTVAGALASLLLIVFGGVYLAINPSLYRDGLVKLVPPAIQPNVNATLDDAGVALKRWLAGQVIAMLLVGSFTGLGLWLLGVPSAFALGFIAGLAEFVPIIGPILAADPRPPHCQHPGLANCSACPCGARCRAAGRKQPAYAPDR